MISGLERFILGSRGGGGWFQISGSQFLVPEGWFDEFRLLQNDLKALQVDHEPRGVDIWFLRVNLGPLSVDLRPLGVKFEPMGVNFGHLRVEFRFAESI